MEKKQLKTGRQLVKAAINLLRDAGGKMPRSELINSLEPAVHQDAKELDGWGRTKWIVRLDVCSSYRKLPFHKYFRKEGRMWYLTEEGHKQSMSELNAPLTGSEPDAEDADISELTQEEYGDNIADYIINMASEPGQTNTGEILERITAALLRGMGYLYVEKRGGPGDGGVDVVGYKDKLGATGRVKAQAKHYTQNQKITANDIRVLESAVQEGEIGMFVTTSSFTKDAIEHARRCVRHIFLVNIDRLVELWVEYYPKMSEQDKELIPLVYKLDAAKIKQRGGDSEKTE